MPAPGPLPLATPRELVGALARTPRAQAFQASGVLQLVSRKGTHNAGVMLFFKAPDSVKMVIQMGLGTTAAEILITGAEGVAYFPQMRQAFTLDAGTAITVGDARVYPGVVTALLRPFDPQALGDSLHVHVSGDYYYLVSRDLAGDRTLKIEGRARRLDTEDYHSTDDTIDWSRSFRVERNQLVPENIIVTFAGATTTMFLRSINVAPRWERSPFSVRLPDNVMLIDPSRE